MELFPAQSRPLLADYYSNTSNEDEDEYYRSENDNSVTITKGDIAGDDIVTSNGSRRNRHQFSNRRTKRYTRCVIICGALVVILLLIYIPLFSNIQSRLGMDVCIQINSNSSCMHESEVGKYYRKCCLEKTKPWIDIFVFSKKIHHPQSQNSFLSTKCITSKCNQTDWVSYTVCTVLSLSNLLTFTFIFAYISYSILLLSSSYLSDLVPVKTKQII